MGIFKDVTQTVKNIFNADDDMMFDDENEFKDGSSNQSSFIKMPFGQKKNENKLYQMNGGKIPSFDLNAHSYDMAQGGQMGMMRKGRSNGKIQVYVPKSFEEAFNIIKDVKSGFTAMVNVEVANPQVSQRIIDVISGAIYALDGECKKMGEKQYIFSLSAETIGAYDYLPTSGAQMNPMQQQQQSNGFNFGMNQPFEFLNQQQMQNQMQQQMQPQEQNFGQNNFTQKSFSQNNQNLMSNANNTDFTKFYQPPKSQF